MLPKDKVVVARRPVRSMFVAQTTLLAVLAVLPALGQTHPEGFYLNTPLSLSSGFDSQFIVGSRAQNDTVTLITGPTLAWFTSTHRTQVSLDYQPEVELFARDSGLNAWNHVANLRINYRLNSRWSLDAGDFFLSTMDPTRKLENSLVLLPRGRFDQNTAFADAVYRFNETTKLTLRVDNALTIVALPSLEGRLDNVATAGTATVDRIFSSRHQITASYSFLHVTPLSSASAGSSSNVNLLILGYTFTVNPSLLIRVTGGGIQGAESAFNGSATIEKKLGGVWIAGGYQRYLGFFGGTSPVGGVTEGTPVFATGVTPNSVYHVFSVRAAGDLTKRIGIETSTQRALGGVDPLGRSITSLISQVKLDYKINDRVKFFIRFDHYGQNINRFFDQSLSRNRYFAGLEIALARPQEADRGRYRHGKAPQEPIAPPVDTTENK